MPGDVPAVRTYHEATKHSVAKLRADPHGLDWENMPIPWKVYTDLQLPALPLPRDFHASTRPALAVIGDTATPPGAALDRTALARLLYFSAGVLRHRKYPGGEIHFRAAACTGALYHIDLYLVTAPLPDLEAGVYHFGPHDFALRRLRAGDHRAALMQAAAGEARLAEAPVHVVYTSTVWRNAWKYRARAYRHCFWDAGTLLANLLAAAAAVRQPARVVQAFVDEEVRRLLDLDAERELGLGIVALGRGATPPPPAPAAPALGLATLPLSPHEISYPQILSANAASALSNTDEVLASRGTVATLPAAGDVPLAPLAPSAVAEPIEAVILRRGSARRFRRTPIARDALATLVALASRPFDTDCVVPTDCYLIVNACDGVAPGTYAVDGSGGALRPLEAGDFRLEAGHLDLGQALAAEAAVNFYWLVDLESVFAALGARGYRAAQLSAAIAGGRVYLGAYALGLGATGLTFFDDDVTAFFSPDAQGKSVLFLMAVGSRAPLAER